MYVRLSLALFILAETLAMQSSRAERADPADQRLHLSWRTLSYCLGPDLRETELVSDRSM